MVILAIGCLLIGFLLGMLVARPRDHEAAALLALEEGDAYKAQAVYDRLFDLPD